MFAPGELRKALTIRRDEQGTGTDAPPVAERGGANTIGNVRSARTDASFDPDRPASDAWPVAHDNAATFITAFVLPVC